MNKKEIPTLIGFILIAIILLSGGAYYYFFAKGNQKEMGGFIQVQKQVKVDGQKGEIAADWKTYKNEHYGFELKYPKQFLVEKDDKTGILINDDKVYNGHFWILIKDNPKRLDANGIKNDFYQKDEYGFQYKESFENIDNITSYKQGRYDLGVIENYFIPYKDKVVEIKFEFNLDSSDTNRANQKGMLIREILSTFKFSI